MSDKRFWRTTPTILNALSDTHAECNMPSSEREKTEVYEFVDEAPFLI